MQIIEADGHPRMQLHDMIQVAGLENCCELCEYICHPLCKTTYTIHHIIYNVRDSDSFDQKLNLFMPRGNNYLCFNYA